jgi:hypothetical protein
MSWTFEVYYRAPRDLNREASISIAVERWGGQFEFVEEPSPSDVSQAVILTYEFDDIAPAEAAASALRQLGEHVEGPCDYGPD